MPRPPRPAAPDTSRETVAAIGAVVRAAGPEGFDGARALARQYAPAAVAFLGEVVRAHQGSLFTQARCAGLILEAAGLVRALPPGSAGTPEAEAAGAGEG